MGKYFYSRRRKIKKKNDKKGNKNQKKSLDNLSSKLAAIILYNQFSKEWLGIESGKKDYFEGRDIYAVFSYKEEKDNNIIIMADKKENIRQQRLRKILVDNGNPFLDESKKWDEIIKQSPGSPIYYRDYNNNAYVIAIFNEFFEFQYFDKNAISFLIEIINKARQLIIMIILLKSI